MDNIYDWNEEYEKMKLAERARVMATVKSSPEHDLEMLEEIKELSNMNSLDKIGQYQFVHNDNNISIRKSSNEMTPR